MSSQWLPYETLRVTEANLLYPEIQDIVNCYYPEGWANLYFTPDGGKVCPRHKESYDVYVLQLSGSKLWYYKDRKLELTPGMVLALPAGTYHSTLSSFEGPSLHLTIRERR